MPKKFYKTTIRVTVLSEDPFDCTDLETIAEATDKGDCVGEVDNEGSVEVTGKEMADLLYAAGSEPGFFQIDDDGKNIYGEDEEE